MEKHDRIAVGYDEEGNITYSRTYHHLDPDRQTYVFKAMSFPKYTLSHLDEYNNYEEDDE